MKASYPVYLIPTTSGYQVQVPDLPSCVTSGADAREALEMAQDALSACLLTLEDHHLPLPEPSAPLPSKIRGALLALVAVDTFAYRVQTDTRAVRKSVSLPSWMAETAEKRGISFSKVLQDSLRAILHL